MKNNGKFKYIYIILLIWILAISTIGSTYAYWTATTSSKDSDINASSTTYEISMKIDPLYNDFSFIPMDDNDALKALENHCKDKFDRGACNAYTINIYDYNTNLGNISGSMDVNLQNIENLSYMVLEEKNEQTETNCTTVNDKIYCITKEATDIGDGTNLSLGDNYDITGTDNKSFILLIWLTNLEQSHNEKDIGNFNAIITFAMGNGGEIKGSIDSVLVNGNDKLQSEE